jgi:hypothetical protein
MFPYNFTELVYPVVQRLMAKIEQILSSREICTRTFASF